MRMIIAIASSDGNFDANEQRVASKIDKEQGLNPGEFELQLVLLLAGCELQF